MRALLDTHTFLWWIADSSKLSKKVYNIIKSTKNELFISAVSGWEIAIKAKLGRLRISGKLELFLSEQFSINAFQILPITISHALHVYSLPNIHRDPFDHMLIAQAQLEDLPILTFDREIAKYKVRVIW